MEQQPTIKRNNDDADERWINEGGHLLRESGDTPPVVPTDVEFPEAPETDQPI